MSTLRTEKFMASDPMLTKSPFEVAEFAKGLESELNEAIDFIKSLNATTGAHGREYRARCGRFLAKIKQPRDK